MSYEWSVAAPSKAIDLTTEFRMRLDADLNARTKKRDIWWSALIRLDKISIPAFDAALGKSFARGYLIPPHYLVDTDDDVAPEKGDDGEQIITIYATQRVLEQLNHSENPFNVLSVHLGATVPAAQINDVANAKPLPEKDVIVQPGTVIMAVIDDGIAFGHDLFRSGLCETRVERMYIMDLKTTGNGSPLPVGSELTRVRINQLLADHTYSDLLDEGSFYHDAGAIDHAPGATSAVAYRRSHGTHVMGLAAGYEMAQAQGKRPILAVQLPSRVTADTSGQSLAPSLNFAIDHILRAARRFRTKDDPKTPVPLVINFSYGNNDGPHDGSDAIAALIDRKLARQKKRFGQDVRVVLPAGNANLQRGHAVVSFGHKDAPKVSILDLKALPDDQTSSYVEMWMPYSDARPRPNFVNVKIASPDGIWSKTVKTKHGSRQVLRNTAGQIIAELFYAHRRKDKTDRGVITLALNPTTSFDLTTPLAPSGIWKIAIEKAEITPDQTVELWVRRDETLPGYAPFGRQAYFDMACYARFDSFGAPLATDPPGGDCPVRRAGTLSGFATGTAPLVIGGLTQRNGLMSDYSGAGPITPYQDQTHPNRAGPDAAARSDDSPVLSGVLSAGSRSGSMVRMNGTSVAAPLVARYIADALENGDTADRPWLAAQASQSDAAHFPAPKPAATRTGGGRLAIPPPFPLNASVG